MNNEEIIKREQNRIIKILENFKDNFPDYIWRNLLFQISGEKKCIKCGRNE